MKIETPEAKELVQNSAPNGTGRGSDDYTKMSNKELLKIRDKYVLHVALVMHQDGIPKAKASFVAWYEGLQGFEKRLSPLPS